MPPLKAPRTYARRSSRRAHGLWRKVTCSRQSLHGWPSTTMGSKRAFPMVSLLILLIVLFVALMVLLLLPTNLRSYVVEAHCMGGLPPFTDSLERLCRGVLR